MDEKEALKLVEETRDKIDKIDIKIINLIQERTRLAQDIARAKMVLDWDIEDPEREEYIQLKIKGLAEELEIDPESLGQIMNILTSMSKEEQKKIVGGN